MLRETLTASNPQHRISHGLEWMQERIEERKKKRTKNESINSSQTKKKNTFKTRRENQIKLHLQINPFFLRRKVEKLETGPSQHTARLNHPLRIWPLQSAASVHIWASERQLDQQKVQPQNKSLCQRNSPSIESRAGSAITSLTQLDVKTCCQAQFHFHKGASVFPMSVTFLSWSLWHNPVVLIRSSDPIRRSNAE